MNASQFLQLTLTTGGPVYARIAPIRMVNSTRSAKRETLILVEALGNFTVKESPAEVARMLAEKGDPFIGLTDSGDGPVFVRAANVMLISQSSAPIGKETYLMIQGLGQAAVKETPAEVVAALTAKAVH